MTTTLLYDADCRFCRAVLAALLAWDRDRRLHPVALQDDEAARLLPGLTRAERLEAMHAIAGGRAGAGGAALPILLSELPAGAPLAALSARFPDAMEAGYAWVAANRGRLSRLIPAALQGRADAVVRHRLESGPA